MKNDKNKESIWGLSFIKNLSPSQYNYVSNISDLTGQNIDTTKTYFGILAQDIEKYIKEQGLDPKNFNILNTDGNYLMVSYNELIAPIIKSIQELDERLKKIEEKLNDKIL